MESPLINALQAEKPLPEKDRQLILSYFTERLVKKDEVLFPGGKTCREMYFICEGVLRMGIVDDNGNDITYFFLKENQFCTILKSFNEGSTAEENITAACGARVLVITRAGLLELYSRLPWLKAIIENIQQRQLIEKIKIKNSLHNGNAASNYQALVDHFPDIALRVSQKDIASFLGITPQSLSRLRKNNH